MKLVSVSKDEEPPALDQDVKQSEEDDFLQLEIQRHGIIQANWKHWHQITMIKQSLNNYFTSIGSAVMFIIQLGLVGLR